jgi:hypothetical protein
VLASKLECLAAGDTHRQAWPIGISIPIKPPSAVEGCGVELLVIPPKPSAQTVRLMPPRVGRRHRRDAELGGRRTLGAPALAKAWRSRCCGIP